MNIKSIKPFSDYLLVKPTEQDTKTASGIILPDSAKEKPQTGEILAVGPGGINEDGKKVEIIVTVGQKVMYKDWAGKEIKLEGEKYTLIQQKDIIALVD